MKKLFQLMLVVSLFLVLSACTTKKTVSTPIVSAVNAPVTSSVSTSTPAPTPTTSTGYTLADVAKHSTANDCWTIINGKVYDVSAYIASAQHPGGSNDAQVCGIDATRIFSNIRKHSSSLTDSVLQQYYLGLKI